MKETTRAGLLVAIDLYKKFLPSYKTCNYNLHYFFGSDSINLCFDINYIYSCYEATWVLSFLLYLAVCFPVNIIIVNITSNKFHVFCAGAALAFLLCGCTRPVPDTAKDSSATPVPQTSGSPNATTPNSANLNSANLTSKSPGANSAQAESSNAEVASAAVHILNKAHRTGAVILHGECGPTGIGALYPLRSPVKLEPMDEALQEISSQYQNLYWRESRESGVRIIDSGSKSALLKVRVREFRIVEDREPDAALAALWRAPDVAAFFRRTRVQLVRRATGSRKVISPPMIIEMKNAVVADILDRIAAGYHSDPAKVWIYRECTDKGKKETLVDVQIK